MRRRRSARVARMFALAIFVLAGRSEAAPPVRLHVAADSTCEGTAGLATRLSGKGVVLSESAEGGVDVDVRAMTTPNGADAELVIRSGTITATRMLNAPTCDEVLDALVFALGLALEQPIEATPPPAPPASSAPPPPPPPPPPAPPAAPPPPARTEAGLGWGAGASAGVFAGASPSAGAALALHVEIESRARAIVAPSLVLGALLVLPSSTSASGNDVSFALQAATLDACPVRLGARVSLRPCLALQVGRLQSRSTGFTGARLESTPWAALALDLRGRFELGLGVAFEVDFSAGSPLIQDVFSVGDQRVFGVGPVLISALAGVAVHFP